MNIVLFIFFVFLWFVRFEGSYENGERVNLTWITKLISLVGIAYCTYVQFGC